MVGSGAPSSARTGTAVRASTTAVGPQYDTTHVYVAPGQEDAFADSWVATFGGTHTTKVVTDVTDVTPTPGETESELPCPFGRETTGYAVEDLTATCTGPRRRARGSCGARTTATATAVAPRWCSSPAATSPSCTRAAAPADRTLETPSWPRPPSWNCRAGSSRSRRSST
ncbi:hypothetical protein ABT404_42550 [Streptomyces hyaluromycini]|uniref:Uncharacterized protein n=1 Tax=Streptomyces hyaluromycini TaxID=1377993 RepID=A0ABV1XAM4_9ACTN